ncbi:arylsulfatase [Novosphingobium aquae]|uniref:Arylsulfatase n=1 Tax=Novosphingobium aquae TaxID=3133435 RepID=A0ABU8SC10_9SPHN
MLIVAGLSTLSGPALAKPAESLAGSRPNVLFILADDLGYGDIGAFGQRIVPTPNLDRLAKQGLLLTQHYAGSTVCAPSRASLMLGRDTGHTPVRGNMEIRGDDEASSGQAPLPAGSFTLGTLFKNAGYQTAAIGKWGLGATASSGAPNRQGFDFFFGYTDQRAAHSYFPQILWRNDQIVKLANPKIPRADKLQGDPADPASYARYVGPDYAQERMTKEAEAYLASRKGGQPFFLYMAYTLPHAAMQVPFAERDRFRSIPETGPYLGRPYTPQQYPRAARAAMVARLDADVGRLMASLRSNGLDRNTLVVFTSDNGPTVEGGQDLDFFKSSGPLRGRKRDLYEGGVRVPTIAWWPRHIAAGARSEAVTAFWDYMPTFAALTGTRAPRYPEGTSFLSVLAGRGLTNRPPLYWEFHGTGAVPHLQAVRFGDWKAVRKWPSSTPGKAAPIELYNLKADPAEERDVAPRNPARVAQAARLLNKRTQSPEGGWNFDKAAEDE